MDRVQARIAAQNYILQKDGEQDILVRKKLSEFSVCKLKNRYEDKLEKIAVPLIKEILDKHFDNAADMKAVSCLLDTIFFSTNRGKYNGFYNLSDKINKFMKDISKPLVRQGVEGDIYMSDVLSKDIKVIIKVPKQNIPNAMREYYIGISTINKLRYKIPTFVYTLGAFSCQHPPIADADLKINAICQGPENVAKNIPFVLYEKIDGVNLGKLLEEEKINFDTWLCIFLQLLLSLEVAQRDHQFTHFDLHTNNVMIRNVSDDFSYDIPLDNKIYQIRNPRIIPVIIDFGYSCAHVDGEYIGLLDYTELGMLNYMVPGYDMYKFLYYSFIASKQQTELREKIYDLFYFFIDDDPYNIIKTGEKGLNDAYDSKFMRLLYTKVASRTPLEMVEWIMKGHQDVTCIFAVKQRNKYTNIKYSNYPKTYDFIFQEHSSGMKETLKLTDNCIKNNKSYVMTKYNIMLLEKYNYESPSNEVRERIEVMKSSISSLDDDHILYDINILEKVFEIKLPKQTEIDRVVNQILDLNTLEFPNHDKAKNHAIKELERVLSYQKEIEPYLQLYYTILELDLKYDYSTWIHDFTRSDIFVLYNKNSTRNHRAIRWGQTLEASIKFAFVWRKHV